LGSFSRAFLMLPRDIAIDRNKPFPRIHPAQPPWSAQKETLPPVGPPDKFRGNKVILAGASFAGAHPHFWPGSDDGEGIA